MKKILKIKVQCICLALLLLNYPVQCWTAESCTPCGPIAYNSKQSSWDFGGWIEAGIMLNQYGQKDAYNNGVFDPNSGNTIHLDNVRHASFQMNQFWFYGEKERDRRRFDIGGRIEFNYGVDAFQAVGLDEGWKSGDYYVSLPQMYLEVGRGDFSVSAGKFFTARGMNSSYGTERFFHSTSYEYQVCADYCAIFATWDATEKISIFSGWTNGEERFFTDFKHNALLCGINWKISPRLHFDYIATVGKNDNESKYLACSLLVHLFLDRWEYSFLWLLRNEDSLEIPGRAGRDGHYGINQELYYTVNDRWRLGVGVEWFRHNDHPANEHWDVFAIQLGTNWKPKPRLTLRSEIRYDKFDGFRPFKNGTKDGQFIYGLSGVVTF